MGFLFGNVQHEVGDDGKDVTLKIVIGDGQQLYTTVVNRVNGSTVYNESPVSLGKGGTLRGKATTVFVSVTDSNPHTDSTSVTLILDNTATQKTFSKDADTPNGTVDYYLTIHHS